MWARQAGAFSPEYLRRRPFTTSATYVTSMAPSRDDREPQGRIEQPLLDARDELPLESPVIGQLDEITAQRYVLRMLARMYSIAFFCAHLSF